jgi:thioredoxin-dependent peroxiredoxin
VTVLAASVDTLKTLEGFGAKNGFTFPLISDTSREIGAAYGVLKENASRSAERDTVVIGTDGTVRLAYERVKAEGHAAQVLADVKVARKTGLL